MEAELPECRDRWLAKMLAASAALAAALAFLAWAAPALRLHCYGLRYRLDWGRDEALDVLAKEALQRRLSSAGVRLLLGEPSCRRWVPDDREELCYRGHRTASWSQDAPGKRFQFEADTVASVAPWPGVGDFCVWENGLDDDSDDPGDTADLQLFYDDRGTLMFRRRFDVAYLGHEWGDGTPPPSRLQRLLNRFRWRQ